MNINNALPRLTLATLLTLALFAVAGAVAPRAHAQVATANPPGKMTFQGFLTDASDPPVPLGNTTPINRSITFKIYKSATGGLATDVVWAETQVVTIDKGHFSVLLGEGTAVSGFDTKHPTDLSDVFIGPDASDRWIGITLEGENEIAPRIQFFATPYAHLARVARQVVDTAGTPVLTGSGSNVGIGTTGPSAKLSVINAGANLGGSALSSTLVTSAGQLGTTAGSELALANLGFLGRNNVSLGVRGYRASNGSDWTTTAIGLGMDVDNTVRAGANLWLHGNGNVGIGTTSPRAKLHVNGSATFDLNTGAAINLAGNANAAFIQAGADNPSMSLNLSAKPSEQAQMSMLYNGNVGIGTTTPAGRLDVTTGNRSTILNPTLSSELFLSSVDSSLGSLGAGARRAMVFGKANANRNAGTLLYNHVADVSTNNYVGIGTFGNDNVLNVTASGNVGIGTTTPAVRLHVQGASGELFRYGDGTRTVYGGVDTNGAWFGTQSSNLMRLTANSLTMMTILPSGKIGIGTSTPATKLHIVGGADEDSLRLQRTGAATYWNIFADVGGDSQSGLMFRSDGNTGAYIRRNNGSYVNFSDLRLKKDVTPLGTVLSRVVQLRPVSFRYKATPDTEPKTLGLIAQEVEPLFPEVVSEANGMKGIGYSELVPVAIRGIQELAEQVDALKKSAARIAELEKTAAKVTALEEKAARVDSLEREVAELKKLVAGLAQGQARPSSRNIAARE